MTIISDAQYLLDRRTLLLGLGGLGLLAACGTEIELNEPDIADAEARLAALEAASGGRIGVSAINLLTGVTLTHRGDERFAMCSSFKWLLGALVLQKVDAGVEDLDRMIKFTQADMVPYAPVTEQALAKGEMSLRDLCNATITTSDNPAANLILRTLGGPNSFTDKLRAAGDSVTRLDRLEPDLNENAPGDPRDTTTPNATVSLMGYYLFGDGLSSSSRDILQGWMTSASTGLGRLRAGIPADWVSGDKTGTSSNDQSNDVAFAFQPATQASGKGHVLIARTR